MARASPNPVGTERDGAGGSPWAGIIVLEVGSPVGPKVNFGGPAGAGVTLGRVGKLILGGSVLGGSILGGSIF